MYAANQKNEDFILVYQISEAVEDCL